MEAPHNTDFERRVLGYALRNPDVRESVCSRLRAEDFYDADHAAVFTAMQARVGAGTYFDSVLLAGEPDLAKGLENDPADLLGNLLNSASTMTSAATDEYIKRLRAYGNARTIIQVGNTLSTSGYESGDSQRSVDEALRVADETIRETTDRVTEASWTSLGDAIADFEPASALEPLFPSGFYDLDNILQGGFRAGQVVVVAGRPATGKSTLAAQIGRHASIAKGVPGMMISLEMDKAEIVMRILSAEGRISLENLQRNTLDDRDHDTIDSIRERLSDGKRRPPFYIVDNISPDLASIRAEVLAAHRRVGIKYVIIDYLQLLTSDGTSNPSRENVVANISRSLKALARSLGITILLVAQLNRNPESRTSKRPVPADLRESGQIEQDADIILLLHRPETYDQEVRPGEADLIVAKHRNGREGDVPLLFQGHYSTFANMTHDDDSASSVA